MPFRTATAEDADRVVALVNAAYRAEGAGGWTTEAHLLEGVRTDRDEVLELVTADGSRIELAEAPDGAVVGCVHVRRDVADAHLGMLSVDPARQAAGVGRALVARAEEVARGWGCARMTMHVVSVRPELLAWYGRRGYRPTGVEVPFDVPPRIGRSRVGALRFLELAKALRDA